MINTHQGEKIYNQINNKLKKEHFWEIIAIETKSGDYFLGKDIIEAYENAMKKHPKKEFYFKRVGAKATFYIGGYMRETALSS